MIRSRLLRFLLLLLLLPVLLAALLWLVLPRWLAAQGIALQAGDWQLQSGGLRIERLQIRQQERPLLDLQQLQLEWALDTRAPLRRLAIAQLDIHLPPARTGGASTTTTLPASLPRWLPQHIELAQLTLDSLPFPLSLQVQQQDGQRLQLQLGAAGLRWEGSLQLDGQGALVLAGALQPLALAGNSLSALPYWPTLLSTAAGRLQLATHLQYRPAQPLLLRADLQLQDVEAIYDRLAIKDLDARLQLQLQGDRLQLQVAALQLASLDPGLPLGPLQLRGSYQTQLDALQAGTLQLEQLETGLLGGRLLVQPLQLALAQWPYSLNLQLQGLDIAALLRAYPARGLDGSGLVDGSLPLQLERDGLRIVDGYIGARAPGGVLQIRIPGLLALGQGNPAMQLVAQALDDFHYARLQSQVNLTSSGQLQLALQLSGHNPALENGRMVNLNVNLEEDLPALLTSLQLSGRVNDAIRQRLQQRLQPRP